MIGLDVMGASVTVATSDIKWSDGTLVQLGTPIYDRAHGRGKISKLTEAASGSKPRVEIEWEGGGTFSWETSVLDATLKQVPPKVSSPKEEGFLSRKIVGPVRVWHAGLAAVAIGGLLWWKLS